MKNDGNNIYFLVQTTATIVANVAFLLSIHSLIDTTRSVAIKL